LRGYGGGVYVGAVPNLLYAMDTDGDLKADIRRIVLTSFGRDVNSEAMLIRFAVF
jgi:3-oxoacyl-[acyl-carrier-protein] synthase III